MNQRSAGIRQLRRDDVTLRILQLGRAHLAQHGAAALSLRAITRELGMVSSAVYRYVANRDELARLTGDLGLDVDPAVLARAVLVWSVLFGAVSLEVFGQYGQDTFRQARLLFEHQVRSALVALAGQGLNAPHRPAGSL